MKVKTQIITIQVERIIKCEEQPEMEYPEVDVEDEAQLYSAVEEAVHDGNFALVKSEIEDGELEWDNKTK